MAKKLDPARLEIDELVALLKKAGSQQAKAELIQALLPRGAPQNTDGTFHLVHFTAWLAQQIK